MTLEEAKKILESEGFKLGGPGKPGKPGKPGVVSEAFAEYESPEICEAMQIVCSAGFQLAMLAGVFDERKERLKKEYEKNTKAPCSGEEQPKENGLKAATDAFILQANEIMRLKKKNAELLEVIDKMKEGNPAIKESASQFNDALLDEQAKKIAELTKEKSNLEDQITVLNACKKHNDKIDRKQIKSLGKEIARLNGIIHDKNAILSDVAEELRLSKIREKNLTEVCQKYMKENEKLKKELAENVVDKIDIQNIRLKGKDEEIRALKLQISALEKRGNGIDWKRNAEAIKLYVSRASRERLWNPINQDICNEQELSFIINHGGMRVKYALRFDGTDIVYECYDPDKKTRIPTPEISVEELMKLQEKACVDIAEEGKDLSGVIVLCGKNFVDALKKVKDVWQE